MKKILSYILVFFVIANLFAPVSVGIKNGQIKISENKISADSVITTTFIATDTTIQAKSEAYTESNPDSIHIIYVIYKDNKYLKSKDVDLTFQNNKIMGQHTFNELDPDTTYKIRTRFITREANTTQISPETGAPMNADGQAFTDTELETEEKDVKTNKSGDDTQTAQGTSFTTDSVDTNIPGRDYLPACNILGINGGTFLGCIAQGLYYLVFMSTSYLFGLAGTFFDNVFAYSINSNSYKSEFVVEGWGIIRDFCNMFFIFILIYAAFGQILGLHGANAKKTIINVVIIGLFINFSLFATQVIIDASNVMAKVFYNSDAIKIENDEGISLTKEGKPIPLSEAIVNKINPQQLIKNASTIGNIPDKGGQSNSLSSPSQGGIGVGTFMLIVILASAVNIVGLIVFLSVSLIFIARVIGLWFAMIFSPLVFLTYTIPSLQDTEMIGWKKWWPETLKLAFLAPVFMFFLYLILAFMEKGLGVFDASGKENIEYVVAILIPFFFIMILLIKAKDIAKDMSGKMGQTITNGIAAAGGLALGVATGGVALAGRKIIGGGLAAMSRTDSAKNYEKKVNQYNKNLKTWKDGGSIGPKPKFKDTLDENGNKIKYNRISGFLGGKLNQKQKDVGHIDHARHEDDEIKKAAGVVDKNGQVLDNSRLTGTDIESMKNKYAQNKRSEAESAIRKGVDGKGKTVSMKDRAGNTYNGENDYKAQNRNRIMTDIHNEGRPEDIDGFELSDAGKKKLEDRLNMELNAIVKANVETKISDDFNKMREDSMKSVNPATRAFSNASRNSYDLRKIADMKSDKRESLFSKVPVALISAVAMGVRTGFKTMGISSNGSNKIEGNFAKDLTNTINEAFKKAKVEVKVDNHGGGHSSANAHGDDHGGGGHGGGGHH